MLRGCPLPGYGPASCGWLLAQVAAAMKGVLHPVKGLSPVPTHRTGAVVAHAARASSCAVHIVPPRATRLVQLVLHSLTAVDAQLAAPSRRAQRVVQSTLDDDGPPPPPPLLWALQLAAIATASHPHRSHLFRINRTKHPSADLVKPRGCASHGGGPARPRWRRVRSLL